MIVEKGFQIERILFESHPGFHVTANVYRPEGEGPFPAILHPCGHSENGKAASVYQKANRLLAENGFLVLCYDPIGQGERKQILGPDRLALHRGSGEHQQLGVAPVLLGQSLGSYMVWDAVRAIDYLCAREDVDAERIGCAGNSGGGNLTSFLMAYDDRVAAAAPGCFVTTLREKNERPGPGDAEQILFAQIRDGFDHPDFMISRLPKPTLILAATKDFVPIAGTWDAFREAKQAATLLGYPERVALIEADEKHGFSKRLREGAVHFFARWLQGRSLKVFEKEDVAVRSDAELQVTPDGQVFHLEEARSILALFEERGEQLAADRPPLTRDVVREVTGIRKLNELPEPKVEVVGGVDPQKLIFRPEPGIVMPALYWSKGKDRPIILAPSGGMNSVVEEAERLNAAGHPVLVIEVRDTGETATRNWRFFGADLYIAFMLGRSWVGMRSEDILVAARWLKEKYPERGLSLVSDGEVGTAARHAAALEPGLISGLRVSGDLMSWQSLLSSKEAHSRVHSAVRDVLRYYDIPDLEKLNR